MMRGLTCKLSMLLVAVALLLPVTASAQIPLTGVKNVILNATLPESLTISLTGATSVTFNPLLPAGVTAGSVPVGVQTSWVLNPSRGSVKLVGYFSSTDALTEPTGPSYINVANVLGRVTTGSPTTFTAFTQTVTGGIGIAGASLLLFSETIIGNNKNKTRTDSLDLEIDLGSVPQQPAGVYTGTLNIQAIVL